MNVTLAILWKDLLSEWRSRDRVVAMLIFSILMAVVFYFALPDHRPEELRALTPGLLWTAYIFAALLGLNRSFALELENDALAGLALAPGNRGWIFLGKAAANWVLISIVQVLTAGVFAVFYRVDLMPALPGLAAVIGLGTVGIAAAGTLLAAMAVRTGFREVLLPILLLPALFPILAGAVEGSLAAVAGGPVPFESLQLLIVVDGVYLVVAFLGFDYVLDE
ncbi:MAG TPA: cytochrome C biogenesis protein [Myxococcales bacterium]|nr:cytochrome C biogenesis protein [Myxococcales bacterium]HIL01108.1 cytochrome C biogenesis protein [Myxococcales bacterium]